MITPAEAEERAEILLAIVEAPDRPDRVVGMTLLFADLDGDDAEAVGVAFGMMMRRRVDLGMDVTPVAAALGALFAACVEVRDLERLYES